MNLNKLARKNILELKPYSSARRSFLTGVLLDANENSFGSVVDSKLELNRYPDPNQTKLRRSVGDYLQVNPDNIFLGVGSDEIIDLLIRIFCEPNKEEVIICEPTYGMYKVACDVNAVKTKTVLLNDNFDIDEESLLKSITPKTKMIFLCSPNNPTGNLLSWKSIAKISKKFNGIIVIDQAYIDFSKELFSAADFKKMKNVVLLRTFSKAWGLAGIRCGFAIADKGIINLLFKVKLPYNINKLTADFVISSLKKNKKKNTFVAKIISEREKIISELKKLDKIITVFPSEANYILFKVENAERLYTALTKSGIIIRNRSSQVKLSNCLRVSIGTPEQNQLFLRELTKIL